MIVADGESGESSEDSDLLDSLCVTRRGVSDGETDSKLSARRAYLGISIYPVPLLTRNSKTSSALTQTSENIILYHIMRSKRTA